MKRMQITLLVAVTFSTTLFAADPDILLTKADPNGAPTLLFISPAKLSQLKAAGPATAASSTPFSVGDLLKRLKLAKAAFSKDGCTGPLHGDSLGLSPKASEIAPSAFANEPVSFIGRVLRVTPGWVPIQAAGETGLVETLTVVSVSEVLRDASHTLHAGSLVSFLQYAGSFTFEGVRFCTHDPDTTPVSVGDEIAAAGQLDETNPLFLTVDATRHVFKVKDGIAFPLRASHAGEEVPAIPVPEIRHFAQAKDGQ